MAPCLGCKSRKCKDCEAKRQERGTLPQTLKWCRERACLVEYTLDVAASDELHVAGAYFTKESSGLDHNWYGHVWCNPPFNDLEAWVLKAWHEWQSDRCGSISMLIPANRTEQAWWQDNVEPFRDKPGGVLTTNYLPGRTRFKGFKGSPPFACVLLVWKYPS